MSAKPTGRVLRDAKVPRKSRSLSALTRPDRTSIPIAVATAFTVTPAHAARASSSIRPIEFSAAAAGRGMQAGCDERAAGLDLAGDGDGIEFPGCAQGDPRRLGPGAVAVLSGA